MLDIESPDLPGTNDMYAIENLDRPGHYWNPDVRRFVSEHDGSYKRYRTVAAARRAFYKLLRDGRVVDVVMDPVELRRARAVLAAQ